MNSSSGGRGTAAAEGPLWSVRADDWAAIQERQVEPAYRAALDALAIAPRTRLLDVGCGAGMFLRLAADRGAEVSGIDASEGLLAHARARTPDARLTQGEIESLPYDDGSFDVVTAFNSIQFAAHPEVALAEAARVAVADGRILMLVWAPLELCEASAFMRALGQLMPPPPPDAPGPFALSDTGALRALASRAGIDVVTVEDVPCAWSYPDEETAVAGLLSAGPSVRLIEHAGEEAVREATIRSLEPFRTRDGGFRMTNTFRYFLGTPRC